jgi:serine/threonine protein kinase
LNSEFGETALTAYRKIRAIADHPALSGVYQTAASWQNNQLVALLKWRPGEPLDNIRGEYLALLADDLQEEGTFDREALILGWAKVLCEGLNVLHVQDWVHGDVSLANILVTRTAACLIDFDLARPAGAVIETPGMRIPGKATTRSSAWRPPVPGHGDQCGAGVLEGTVEWVS